MIGFMVMLISIIARIESGKIAGNSLSLVQCRAWEDITRMRSDMMGRTAPAKHRAQSRIRTGCHNAATLGSILFGSQSFRKALSVRGKTDVAISRSTSRSTKAEIDRTVRATR
jgi:hypothetical protein